MRRYQSSDEDSARWDGFALRDGDIVVSTRSKHGTTWVQHILLLLIHRDPRPTVPLVELSPWLDHLVEPRAEVVGRLEAQDHRRVAAQRRQRRAGPLRRPVGGPGT
jgi:aryl sulfotransferase